MSMRTIKDIAKGEKGWVLKKGKMYIADVNGEFGLTSKQANAIFLPLVIYPKPAKIDSWVSYQCIDDHNARVIGNRFSIVTINH